MALAQTKKGTTIRAGWTLAARRRALSRSCELFVCVEGGPGTAHETQLIIERGATVIPVGRSGGHANSLYGRLVRPDWADEVNWSHLGAVESTPKIIGDSIAQLVRRYLQRERPRGVLP